MIHECMKYNERVKCVDGSIPEDEPVFLLRGTDIHAYEVILEWLKFKRGLSADKKASVLRHAQRMRDYELKQSDYGCTS